MTNLDERMKALEDTRRFPSDIPIIARLDGKNFHAWTHNLEKPFDPNLTQVMIDVTRQLMMDTNALLGYTQSDEITLCWYPQSPSEPPFGGKLQKMNSILASYCTYWFNNSFLDENTEPAFFDCRVFPVLDLSEAANVFLWRRLDAEKNSVSAAASTYISAKKLHGIKHAQRLQMLAEFGIDWDAEYDDENKYGTFIRRTIIVRPYSRLELNVLPLKHKAHTNPDLKVERQEFRVISPTPSNYLEIFDLLK